MDAAVVPGAEINLSATNLTGLAKAIGPDGLISREGDMVVVRAIDKEYLLKIPGVVCENPEAPMAERIYRKDFKNKTIYLPGEYQKAVHDVLSGTDVACIGMTGFSAIGAENCKAWGITEETYVAACQDLLGQTINTLQKHFPGIKIKLVDGASDMGVDRATIGVAQVMNLDHLGFSCPNFMFYVNDDKAPVYVAANQSEYADAFVRSLNILFSVGGRKQALEHDMLAAVKYDKRLVLLNVLRSICKSGGPQARDGDGKIIDATSAFEQALSLQGILGQHSSDPFKDLCTFAGDAADRICRAILAPERAYGGWRRGN